MTTDIAETIARWKGRLERTKMMRVTVYEIEAADLTALIDAAESAATARDAALEEAAAIADRFAKFTKQAVCVDISDRIRALRSKP